MAEDRRNTESLAERRAQALTLDRNLLAELLGQAELLKQHIPGNTYFTVFFIKGYVTWRMAGYINDL